MYRQLILPIVLVALSVTAFYVYIDPAYKDILKIQQDIGRYDEALDKSQELIQLRDKLLSRYNSFSTDELSQLRAMLPQSADKIRLIIGLNRLGNEFDIQPQGIRFSQTDTSAAESAITTQTIEFTVEDATYSEFIGFVQKIQQAERIMDIQKVSMQRQDVVSQTDEGSGLSYQVEINAYQMQTM